MHDHASSRCEHFSTSTMSQVSVRVAVLSAARAQPQASSLVQISEVSSLVLCLQLFKSSPTHVFASVRNVQAPVRKVLLWALTRRTHTSHLVSQLQTHPRRGQPSPVCQITAVLVSFVDEKVARWGEALTGKHICRAKVKNGAVDVQPDPSRNKSSDCAAPAARHLTAGWSHVTASDEEQGWGEVLFNIILDNHNTSRYIEHKLWLVNWNAKQIPLESVPRFSSYSTCSRVPSSWAPAHVHMGALRHVSGIPNGSHAARFHFISSKLCCDMHWRAQAPRFTVRFMMRTYCWCAHRRIPCTAV